MATDKKPRPREAISEIFELITSINIFISSHHRKPLVFHDLPVRVRYFHGIFAYNAGDIVVLYRGLDVGLKASSAYARAAQNFGLVEGKVAEVALHTSAALLLVLLGF